MKKYIAKLDKMTVGELMREKALVSSSELKKDEKKERIEAIKYMMRTKLPDSYRK